MLKFTVFGFCWNKSSASRRTNRYDVIISACNSTSIASPSSITSYSKKSTNRNLYDRPRCGGNSPYLSTHMLLVVTLSKIFSSNFNQGHRWALRKLSVLLWQGWVRVEVEFQWHLDHRHRHRNQGNHRLPYHPCYHRVSS